MREDLGQLKEDLCEIGRRVWARGFVASNDGNFSVRLEDGSFLSTPTMMSKGYMTPDDMVIVDAEGKKLAGKREPTSEIRMHLFIYKNRPDVKAVVHAHPPHATAFCVARRSLPKCVLPEVEVFLGEIPMAAYETPGTWKFAETLAPHVADHQVFLLASHGAVAAGRDAFEAFHRLESLEHYCRVLMLAGQLGGWKQLDVGAVGDLLQIRRKMGLPDRRLSQPPEQWCRSWPEDASRTVPPSPPLEPVRPAPPSEPAKPLSPAPFDLPDPEKKAPASRKLLRELVARALRDEIGS